MELTGYTRERGLWGVRNHTLVLAVQAAAAAAVRSAAEAVPGAVGITHEWTAALDDPDRELFVRTLAGTAANPNVASAVIVGVGEADREVAEAAAELGADVCFAALADHRGTAGTVEAVVPMLAERVRRDSALARQVMPIEALAVGLECGGSDALSGVTANPALGLASDRLIAEGATTVLSEVPELVGAEELLARRAVTPGVGQQIIRTIHEFEESVRRLGIDIRGAQPTPGNIAGGLTTIEEKSLGAAKKGGSAPITGVLGFAERFAGPGLYIMDTPGHDIESVVGMLAGGCNLIAFTTGRGSPTGSPIAPVLKIATNTPTFERLEDDIDLDAGAILDGRETLESMGERIYESLLRTAVGNPTSAERRGNHEFALRRVTYAA